MKTTSPSEEQLLEVRDVSQYFAAPSSGLLRRRRMVSAVDHVSFHIHRGETFGLVGESGCGKSTLGRAILQLPRPTSGRVIFKGATVTDLKGAALQRVRRSMQMVFQDSYASLNPRMTVGDNIAEPLVIHDYPLAKRRERIGELLGLVGLPPKAAARYPHEFSGGQRQRINIARALSLHPELVICDEPISAVDVSIQAQIINLLQELQVKLGLTYMFISHDLAVVRHICHRVAVMYLGHIVEIAPRDSLFDTPKHPYTRALLSAIPIPDPRIEAAREQQRIVLSGEVPSLSARPAGCCFSARCPALGDVRRRFGINCATTAPVLAATRASDEHRVACHLYAPSRPQGR